MSWFLTNFISAFLLPPLNLLLVAGIGLYLWHPRPRLARILVTTTLSLLWLLSTPYIADALLRHLEGSPVEINTSAADAIVVLGGGTYFHAPEYGSDTVSTATLERLRYAAKLHRLTGKPILVSAGSPLGNDTSEGQQMKQVLEQEFGVQVTWVEAASNNTFDNAHMSHALLTEAGIGHIYLVTHAWHMPRSRRVFESAGFVVTPAPTAYTTRYQTDLLTFLPSADALQNSRHFLHELIGMAWYRLKS